MVSRMGFIFLHLHLHLHLYLYFCFWRCTFHTTKADQLSFSAHRLIHYTPQATIVRLLTINAVNAYLTMTVLSLAGGFQDARLMLPGWIGMATVRWTRGTTHYNRPFPPLVANNRLVR